MEDNDAVQEGHVLDVQHLDKAGLRPTDLYVRSCFISLWQVLSRSSCVVQGPPGVGKSTAVWFWLLARVSAMNSTSNRRVLWCHFRPSYSSTYLVITIGPQQELQFKRVKPSNLLKEERFGICVMDGVRHENRAKVNEFCDELEFDQMVCVSSQQIVIPRENLLELELEDFSCSSWTREEINSYAAVMREEEKASVVADFKDTMAGRIDDRDYSMDEVVEIKYWFFGGSARYMFGLTMKHALADIQDHVHKITDAEQVFRGLTGSRGLLSVNHIISHFPGADEEFRLLSPHVIELLSTQVGFAAIRMFYRSSWVRGNPTVHGFVFEWDLFTQIKQYGQLALSSGQAGNMDTTWTVDQDISLKSFLAGTSTAARIMVRPEKWNHPEYDGLYIHTNQHGEKELVAWNASEAVKHSGSVTKLCLLLREIPRSPLDHPLIFDNVRFVFIVPIDNIGRFEVPSYSAQSIARHQLRRWHFSGFEVLGGKRTVEEH
jgi:hypothetical protein